VVWERLVGGRRDVCSDAGDSEGDTRAGAARLTTVTMTGAVRGRMLDMVECEWFGDDEGMREAVGVMLRTDVRERGTARELLTSLCESNY
jgi:hypothetical protein